MDNKPRNPSRFGGLLGGVLLLSVLFVLVLGVYGAVYLDEFRPAGGTAAQLPPAATGQNFAIAPLPEINPAASRESPIPIEAARPGYWVEYGAYLGPRYAELLVTKLDALGVKAVVTRAPGAGGLTYYRVRSISNATRESADAESRKVAAAMDIDPLVHRAGSETAAAAFVPRAAMAPDPDMRYWVQYGAYNLEGYAKIYTARLRDSGLDVAVIERRHADGRPLYLVRSLPLKTRAEADSLAARGQALGSDVLVGHSSTGL